MLFVSIYIYISTHLPRKFLVNDGNFTCLEVLSKMNYPITNGVLSLTLHPYQFLWLNLDVYGVMPS